MADNVSIELKAIQPIKGDVLIVSSDRSLTPEMVQNIERGFKEHLPDQKVIVVNNLQVSAIRPVNLNQGVLVTEVSDEQET